MDINQLLFNVGALNFNEVIEDSLYDLSPNIVKAQKDQLIHGYLSTGKKTGKYASKAYAAKKFGMNTLAGFGRKDYKLSSDFQRGIFVDVRATELVFGSLDAKTQQILNAPYNDGEDILGLNPNSKKQLVPELQSTAVPKIEAIILSGL
jgi:hypothetical protein